jgi:hypothetical protein
MDEKEPTQRTERGYEIPVPTREQIERDFAKVMAPVPPKPKKRKVRHKRGEGQSPPKPS